LSNGAAAFPTQVVPAPLNESEVVFRHFGEGFGAIPEAKPEAGLQP